MGDDREKQQALDFAAGVLLGMGLSRRDSVIVTPSSVNGGGVTPVTGTFDRSQSGAFAVGGTWFWGLATGSLNLVTPGAAIAATCPLPVLVPLSNVVMRFRTLQDLGGGVISLREYSLGADYGATAIPAGTLDITSAPFTLPAGSYSFRVTGPGNVEDPRFTLTFQCP